MLHVYYCTIQAISLCGTLYPVGYFIGEGNGTPLQYSCLENPMDRGAWWAAVHGVARSRTRLSNLTFTFHFHALEKEMATHSSVLALRIPGTGKPVGCSLWGRTESNTTEATQQQQQQVILYMMAHTFSFTVLLYAPPLPLPTDSHQFVLYICEAGYVCLLYSLVLHISDNRIFSLLLTYFTKHNTSWAHPSFYKWHYFIIFQA